MVRRVQSMQKRAGLTVENVDAALLVMSAYVLTHGSDGEIILPVVVHVTHRYFSAEVSAYLRVRTIDCA